jgi:hypothetical protein
VQFHRFAVECAGFIKPGRCSVTSEKRKVSRSGSNIKTVLCDALLGRPYRDRQQACVDDVKLGRFQQSLELIPKPGFDATQHNRNDCSRTATYLPVKPDWSIAH